MELYDWYIINKVEEIDTPALVIYLDRVKKNIEQVKSMIDNVNRLRPHVKTHKCAELVRIQMDAGISKFKCATIAEAEMLGSCGAQDVLMAYQPVGPKAQRFIGLIKKYPSTVFSCLIDDENAALALASFAIDNGIEIPVFLDLNVGMNRTGVVPGPEAMVLYEQLAGMKGLKPVGLHVYDGHISDEDFQKRMQRCEASFMPVVQLKDALHQKGYKEIIIVAGGSPTFPVHALRKEVECSPGTFIFWDAGYLQSLPEQPFLPAALVLCRVISKPQNFLVCTDMGHKSVAAENPLVKRVTFINFPDLEIISQSEEHLVLKDRSERAPHIGQILYGLPWHICPTVALYESAYIISDKEAIGRWEIVARNRKVNI